MNSNHNLCVVAELYTFLLYCLVNFISKILLYFFRVASFSEYQSDFYILSDKNFQHNIKQELIPTQTIELSFTSFFNSYQRVLYADTKNVASLPQFNTTIKLIMSSCVSTIVNPINTEIPLRTRQPFVRKMLTY